MSQVIPGDAPARSFERAFQAIERVEGWLTEGQARILYDRAASLEPGDRIVEIGSHHGRSTILFAVAAPPEVEIIAIDPFARAERTPVDRLADAEVGERDFELFRANLERAGVRPRIRLVRAFSSDALVRLPGPVDLLYVDGGHEFSTAQSDIRDWGARVPVGGTMLVHDSFCSVGVTLAQLVTLFFGGDFRYLGRSRSLAEYRRERLAPSARLRNAARQAVELLWFLRNVIVKLALVARLRPVARAMGHTDSTFPY